MNNSSIFTATYQDTFAVSFTNDGWINATQIAKQYGKKPDDYLKSDRTKDYISALIDSLFPVAGNPVTEQKSTSLKIEVKQNQLVRIKNGGRDGEKGTWFHPKLAIDFARWLNAKFAVWCDLQIEKILKGKTVDIDPINTPTQKPNDSDSYFAKHGYRQHITEAMKTHLKHHVSTLTRDSNCTPKSIWGEFGKHFGIRSYQYLPIEKYPAACTYFGILPIFEPEHTNNFKLVDVAELEQLRKDATIDDTMTLISKKRLAELEILATQATDEHYRRKETTSGLKAEMKLRADVDRGINKIFDGLDILTGLKPIDIFAE